MNRWTVYEYMKNYYTRYGRVPSENIIGFEFAKVSKEELNEGILEFSRWWWHEN